MLRHCIVQEFICKAHFNCIKVFASVKLCNTSMIISFKKPALINSQRRQPQLFENYVGDFELISQAQKHDINIFRRTYT